jgi:triosephosphate isomerase
MIRPLIAGNWKMHKTVPQALEFVGRLAGMLPATLDRDVVIAPPFTALGAVAALLKKSAIRVAAQNLYGEEKGAFTGEISAGMLVDCGCTYVIIGHSERRTLFGERDEDVNRKAEAALTAGLKPIVCIGETLSERESGTTFRVLERQLKEGLKNLSFSGIRQAVIAYEPVWAIGTGRTARPEQAQEAHAFIRTVVGTIGTGDAARNLPILYGGSVHTGNIDELMAQPDVNGVLVGGASLEVESFARIIQYK